MGANSTFGVLVYKPRESYWVDVSALTSFDAVKAAEAEGYEPVYGPYGWHVKSWDAHYHFTEHRGSE